MVIVSPDGLFQIIAEIEHKQRMKTQFPNEIVCHDLYDRYVLLIYIIIIR